MHEKLQDLRLLYLAQQVEEVFEKLERAFERRLTGVVRQTVQPLFEGGPAHHRLEAELARLNAELAGAEKELTEHDLLQALLECERLAQGFYSLHLQDLCDPNLVQLFRELETEEGRHIRAVERALELVLPK